MLFVIFVIFSLNLTGIGVEGIVYSDQGSSGGGHNETLDPTDFLETGSYDQDAAAADSSEIINPGSEAENADLVIAEGETGLR